MSYPQIPQNASTATIKKMLLEQAKEFMAKGQSPETAAATVANNRYGGEYYYLRIQILNALKPRAPKHQQKRTWVTPTHAHRTAIAMARNEENAPVFSS
jgi:hypothetical protein